MSWEARPCCCCRCCCCLRGPWPLACRPHLARLPLVPWPKLQLFRPAHGFKSTPLLRPRCDRAGIGPAALCEAARVGAATRGGGRIGGGGAERGTGVVPGRRPRPCVAWEPPFLAAAVHRCVCRSLSAGVCLQGTGNTVCARIGSGRQCCAAGCCEVPARWLGFSRRLAAFVLTDAYAKQACQWPKRPREVPAGHAERLSRDQTCRAALCHSVLILLPYTSK